MGDFVQSPLQAMLLGLGGVVAAVIAALAVKWYGSQTRRRWRTLLGLVILALAFFGGAGLLEVRPGSPEAPEQAVSRATPDELSRPTPTARPATPTPTATTRGAFAAQCGDVLPPEICEQRAPSRPWVRLKIGTVAVDEAGVLQISVTLTNEGTDQGVVSVSNSDYDIAAWYAVDESGSVYRANDALSDSGIRRFILFEDDSVSGFVRFRELNPDARCVTLFLPPFGEAGPLRTGGVATCQ